MSNKASRLFKYAVKGFRFRGRILFYWLIGHRNNVGFFELLRFLFKPTYLKKSAGYIESKSIRGKYLSVKFKGLEGQLYYPSKLDTFPLYQVVNEAFTPWHWHYYETPETVVEPNDIVVDCGAAEGLFGFITARRCKKVYLVEPLPDFIGALKMTFRPFKNTVILPYALGDKPGIGYLSMEDISSSLCKDKKGTKVRITTIDKLFFDKKIPVTYIKGDLEGFEMNMLRGAIKTIKKYKPKIAITTYHMAEHASEISALLKKTVPQYEITLRGVEDRFGAPVMLHARVRDAS
jgi:FkbM family methyltransferase